MRRLILLASAAMLAAAAPGAAQMATAISAAVADAQRPAADTARDADRKPAALLAFAGVKPGDKVADLIPGHGYFTRLMAVLVKPGGSVVAIVPAAAAKLDGEGAAMITAIAANPAYGNVKVVENVGDPAVSKIDVFWTAQNYHDLHNALPVDGVIEANEAVYAALKPGGVFIVIDHAAVPDSALAATKTLHRIDPETVKAEVTAAGFEFEAASNVLANPDDTHIRNVFDPAIRGHTDQFVFRFRKPRR